MDVFIKEVLTLATDEVLSDILRASDSLNRIAIGELYSI